MIPKSAFIYIFLCQILLFLSGTAGLQEVPKLWKDKSQTWATGTAMDTSTLLKVNLSSETFCCKLNYTFFVKKLLPERKTYTFSEIWICWYSSKAQCFGFLFLDSFDLNSAEEPVETLEVLFKLNSPKHPLNT